MLKLGGRVTAHNLSKALVQRNNASINTKWNIALYLKTNRNYCTTHICDKYTKYNTNDKYNIPNEHQIKSRSYASTTLKNTTFNEYDIGYVTSRRHKPIKIGENPHKLHEILLITKGWGHNKSINDYFAIEPISKDYDVPKHNFDDILGSNSHFLPSLNDLNVHYATDLQRDAITALKNGDNCIIAAETGCGKTLSYLLPLCEKLVSTKHEETGDLNSPRAVVLVPNRELAHQVATVAKKLLENTDLNVEVIVGGKTKKLMLNPGMNPVDLLISTPGVLGKLSTVGIYKLGSLTFYILLL